MRNLSLTAVLFSALLASSAHAQLTQLEIAAGTPEDNALQAITAEPDGQKKVAMYEDFVQKFASNPVAVAYGNWQISQYYQTSGDLQKALTYGDKATAAAPDNLDILVSQATVAQKLKDDAKLADYAARGGTAYNTFGKAKPEGVSDEDFAKHVAEQKESAKGSYEFLETSGMNAIADEKDPKARMTEIEHYTAAFPSSQFQDQVAQYAMYTLGQLNDSARLVSYGEKALATNPNNVAVLLMMANYYVEDTKPASVAKAVTYSQKVIDLTKTGADDKSHRLSAGSAHSILGYAYLKQDKTAAGIPELKTACELLKGQDDVSYAAAMYRLGFAYAKLNKVDDARTVLMEVVKMDTPLQQPSKDLLAKVNSARAKAK
jgi:tetratricopeptide (TPR) repeat protein